MRELTASLSSRCAASSSDWSLESGAFSMPYTGCIAPAVIRQTAKAFIQSRIFWVRISNLESIQTARAVTQFLGRYSDLVEQAQIQVRQGRFAFVGHVTPARHASSGAASDDNRQVALAVNRGDAQVAAVND